MFCVRCFAMWSVAALLSLALASGCGEKTSGNGPRCKDGVCDYPNEDIQSCPEDCTEVCGNGVAEPGAGEECDTDDFAGSACEDFGCGNGVLSCDEDCRTVTTGCGSPCGVFCGDGVRDATEQCDCGVDPRDLPPICPAVNGDPVSVCGADCRWSVFCGNQVLDPGEECDCGVDPDTLPAGCTAVNGAVDGTCRVDCMRACQVNVWDNPGCDPAQPDQQCCPDAWGNGAVCYSLDVDWHECVLSCNTTDDCHYNHFCDTWDEVCIPAFCGPGGFSGSLNAPCSVPGGGDGWCLPVGAAEWDLGICIESSPNAVRVGLECEPYADVTVTFPRDQMKETCRDGVCYDHNDDGAFECVQLCDWLDVYDNDTNDQACPAGYNCISESIIDPDDPDPEFTNRRLGDMAWCLPTTATDPVDGMDGCDVANGELVADRATHCTDIDPAFGCWPEVYTGGGGMTGTWGTLIGTCRAPSFSPVILSWQACNPQTDFCEGGTFCFPEDAFALSPAGSHRCVPFCDTEDATPCTTYHPEVPPTNTCTTLSAYFLPGAQPGTTLDGSPSRLGLCANAP